jgi:hypothetical protein
VELREQDVSLKMLARILPLLDKLHDCGTERDSAGNRTLFYDDYAKLVLVYLFNPLINSISMLQRAAALPKLAEQLGLKPFSKASFSEAPAVFDPALMAAIVRELAGDARALPADPRLADLKRALKLADGTLLTALPKLVETLCRRSRDGSPYHAFRGHGVLDLRTGLPDLIRLTGGSPKGPDHERRVLEAAVLPGNLYVADRGYFDKKLFAHIVKQGSSYVFRAQDNLVYEVVEDRPLSPAAIADGVLKDQVVRLADLTLSGVEGDHLVHLVTVRADVHAKRTRNGTIDSSGQMLLVSDDLTMAPELVSLCYRYRWTIETFFKFLKQMLGCRHLISQRKAGVEIQVYGAMIACLLLNLATGVRPCKALLEVLLWHQLGFASDEDVLARIEKTRLDQAKAHAKKIAR